MDMNNPLVLYAAMWEHQRKPWKVISGGAGSGLYKTSDGGETWPVIKNKSRKTLLSIAKVSDHFIAPGIDGTIAYIAKVLVLLFQ